MKQKNKKTLSLINNYFKILGGDIKFSPGIYFSKVTGKIFEATVDKEGRVKPKYTCGGYGPKVAVTTFKSQFHTLDCYELLVAYDS